MTIVDAHLHVWNRARAEYSWLGPDLPEVDRDIEFAEIAPTLDTVGVDGVVLVQSADNIDDTRNMLDVADADSRILGVVGWVPLEDPTAAATSLDELARSPKIVGIRNLIHDRPDPDWALTPAFGEGLELLFERGLPFDFVTSGPAALSRLATVADQHPGVTFVLDHLGKPPIGRSAAELDEWAALLQEVAQAPNVMAKASGLYSASGDESAWTVDQVRAVFDVAVDAFGPSRLMYGGDWPMSLRAGGYERVIAALREITSEWSPTDSDSYWWRTAATVYSLDIPANK